MVQCCCCAQVTWDRIGGGGVSDKDWEDLKESEKDGDIRQMSLLALMLANKAAGVPSLMRLRTFELVRNYHAAVDEWNRHRHEPPAGFPKVQQGQRR